MEPPFEPLTDFRGVARLFPLPNLVLFPQTVAPLHIFEPRYRAMMEDALAGDGLIAMALLLPGWENDYEGRPPVAPVVCVGRILTHSRLPDGRFNLLLAGVQRAALRQELPPTQLFREAEVELLEDQYPAAGLQDRAPAREELLQLVAARLPASAAAQEQFEQFLSRPLPLGALVDLLAHAVPCSAFVKQQLLEELNVDRRAALLREQLLQFADGAPSKDLPSNGFPRFSDN